MQMGVGGAKAAAGAEISARVEMLPHDLIVLCVGVQQTWVLTVPCVFRIISCGLPHLASLSLGYKPERHDDAPRLSVPQSIGRKGMRLLGRRERFAFWKRRGRKELGRLGCFIDCRA